MQRLTHVDAGRKSETSNIWMNMLKQMEVNFASHYLHNYLLVLNIFQN